MGRAVEDRFQGRISRWRLSPSTNFCAAASTRWPSAVICGSSRLKADAVLRAIPVIAVTSHALSGDAERARAAGCDAYIAKPYSPRQLLAKVREYLSSPAPTR